MFSGRNKQKVEKETKNVVSTRRVVQYTTVTQTEQKVVRRNSYSTPLSLYPPLSALTASSNSSSRLNYDSKPLNLNYSSPYRNSPAYSSFQNKTSTVPAINTNLYGPGRTVPPRTPSPNPIFPPSRPPVSSSQKKEKLLVKKTGKFYDSNCSIPTYQTHSKNRGEILIINNIMFEGKGERYGAKMDDENLENMFKQMRFTVKVHRNLKSNDMITKLKTFSQKSSLKTADIAIIIVMSHGTKNTTMGGTEVFGLDEKGVLVEEIIDFFNNAKCRYMIDKPKIFIFQCCRGDNEQFVQSDATPLTSIPTCTDALIAYSSLPGFVSRRDPQFGTWYISTLCQVFSQFAHEHHVEDLLKMVDQELKSKDSNVKQTTNYESRGFKRCYLHPI